MAEALSNQYFEEPMATELEQSRDKARKKHWITYDCFNAIIKGSNPTRVVCKKKHWARERALTVILRGVSATACQLCPDYDSGGKDD